ncbi:MAG: bifunctional folylpolyglutamate synthase/ dihydrofolate synthase [Gammaproteobacteria bacterium]|nr:MAG: bifunctional folylpolyglutamate synthase/ dihydrofolate synthase [Gammaproteobacteria bacterium]
MERHIISAKRDLNAWLSYYEQLHPVGIDLGLSRVGKVWQKLCQTYRIRRLARDKTISVAGTNGKGSGAQMLSMLLSAQGYGVGTYTSPHIHHFNERIKINGRSVKDRLIIEAFEAIEAAREGTTLSYFEATTLAGLLVFAWQQVDFAVLEVGLGGRLDATNVVDADAALITSVGLDHEAYLGRDIEQIAIEKAGICRPNKPAVYAQTGMYPALKAYVKKHRIPLIANGLDYQVVGERVTFARNQFVIPEEICDLGRHQISNCAGVLVLLSILERLPSDYQSILSRFSLPGRLQKISDRPDIFVDVAHNADAAKALADYVRRHKKPYQHCYAVLGMLGDKDHKALLSELTGIFDKVFLGTTQGQRGFSDRDLLGTAKQVLQCPVEACGRLTDALKRAKQQASSDDVIYAFGSFLVVEALTSCTLVAK